MPEGLVPRSTGHRFRAERFVPMPEKVLGKHRWIVIATYHTTAAALQRAHRGEDLHCDMENLVHVAEGCVDCEQPYPAPEPCPAGDEWGGLPDAC